MRRAARSGVVGVVISIGVLFANIRNASAQVVAAPDLGINDRSGFDMGLRAGVRFGFPTNWFIGRLFGAIVMQPEIGASYHYLSAVAPRPFSDGSVHVADVFVGTRLGFAGFTDPWQRYSYALSALTHVGPAFDPVLGRTGWVDDLGAAFEIRYWLPYVRAAPGVHVIYTKLHAGDIDVGWWTFGAQLTFRAYP